MIIIRHTPPEIDISGTVEELLAVWEKLVALAHGKATECHIEADTKANPAPYSRALNALIARVTTGPTRVSVTKDTVEVNGSRESLEAFASFFGFGEDAPPGTHNHHEYFEGNRFVHPQSAPLIIGIRPQA